MFVTTVTPRFGDIDGLGHVNNTVLPEWFELARNPIFRMFEPDLDLTHGKWNLIMARIDFDFIGEMFFDGDVEIRTYVQKIGNSSFTLLHEAWQKGEMKTRGTAVLVHYDFINKKSVPLPDEIKEALSEHLVSD
ncbi:MAG: acyl-CoA thioesterase [Halobacteriota archaeon]